VTGPPETRRSLRINLPARPVLAVLAGAALATLAACGGTTPAAGTTGGGATTPTQQPPSGASGLVAAISGSTVQVQNETDGQIAVTYTASTTFTATVAATTSDLKVGACVTAQPASTSSGSEAGSPVAAASIRITQPAADGTCTGGFPGGGGPNGRTPPSGAPAGLPSGAPTGGPGPNGNGVGRGASGQITAMTADGFTVRSTAPPGASAGTTQTNEVTYSSSTTFTKVAAATSAALAVGKCVTAMGDHDSTGAVTATSIQVTDAVNGRCTGGFGGRPGQDAANGQGAGS
jgi:Domain of unknown function (DUF5666)